MGANGADSTKSRSEESPGGELHEELEFYRSLRPFLADCLALNHEINNPLAGVLGYAEFMLFDKARLTAEQIENMQQIVQCAERIQKIIAKLSDEKMKLAARIDVDRFMVECRNAEVPSE